MAESGDTGSVKVKEFDTYESDDNEKAFVDLEIPNLSVKKETIMSKITKFVGHAEPGSEKPEIDVKFDTMSFEFKATVPKDGETTNYYLKVNKLPGEITPEKCGYEYKDKKVIITLQKKEATTWAVLLSENGLDQAPSK